MKISLEEKAIIQSALTRECVALLKARCNHPENDEAAIAHELAKRLLFKLCQAWGCCD